jgi:hypothetical protein
MAVVILLMPWCGCQQWDVGEDRKGWTVDNSDKVEQRFVRNPNKEAFTQDDCEKRQPTGQGREAVVNQRIGTREEPEVTRRQLAGRVQQKRTSQR